MSPAHFHMDSVSCQAKSNVSNSPPKLRMDVLDNCANPSYKQHNNLQTLHISRRAMRNQGIIVPDRRNRRTLFLESLCICWTGYLECACGRLGGFGALEAPASCSSSGVEPANSYSFMPAGLAQGPYASQGPRHPRMREGKI